jgi:hypothetical protein
MAWPQVIAWNYFDDHSAGSHTPLLNHIRIGICRFNCCGLQFTWWIPVYMCVRCSFYAAADSWSAEFVFMGLAPSPLSAALASRSSSKFVIIQMDAVLYGVLNKAARIILRPSIAGFYYLTFKSLLESIRVESPWRRGQICVIPIGIGSLNLHFNFWLPIKWGAKIFTFFNFWLLLFRGHCILTLFYDNDEMDWD